MNPTITSRHHASPWGGAAKGMAWHHVIPFAVLRDVWNLLVNRCIATDLAEARTAIRHHLLLCCRDLPNVDATIECIRAIDPDRRRAGHRSGGVLDVPQAHRLETAAVWQGWNIVEGPSN